MTVLRTWAGQDYTSTGIAFGRWSYTLSVTPFPQRQHVKAIERMIADSLRRVARPDEMTAADLFGEDLPAKMAEGDL